jgi:hypothetical protein
VDRYCDLLIHGPFILFYLTIKKGYGRNGFLNLTNRGSWTMWPFVSSTSKASGCKQRVHWIEAWMVMVIAVIKNKRRGLSRSSPSSRKFYFQVTLPSPVIGKDVSPQHLTPPSLMSAQPIYSPDPMASTPWVNPMASTGLLDRNVPSPNWPK